MSGDVTIAIVVGAFTLVSALATSIVQHWLSLSRQKHEMRNYPRQAVYNKQMEFYEKSTQILWRLNGYITALNVWLEKTSPEADRRVQELKVKTRPFWEFHRLLDDFSMYLPEKILIAGYALLEECSYLPNSPDVGRTDQCTKLLNSFRNTIRECAGTDKLSNELLKAFEARERRLITKDEGKDR